MVRGTLVIRKMVPGHLDDADARYAPFRFSNAKSESHLKESFYRITSDGKAILLLFHKDK